MTRDRHRARPRTARIDPGVRDVGAHVGRAVTRRPGRRRQLQRGVGHHRRRRRLRQDGARDRATSPRRRRRYGRRTYSAQKIRDVGAAERAARTSARRRAERADRHRQAARRPRLRRGPRDVLAARRPSGCADVMTGVDGVVDPTVELPPTQPTIEIETNLDHARRYGVKPGDVRRAEAHPAAGHPGRQHLRSRRSSTSWCRVPRSIATSVDGVRNLLIDGPAAGHVRLGRRRRRPRRRARPRSSSATACRAGIDVVADVSGRSVDRCHDDVEARLADMPLPAGVPRRGTDD